ncbi:hypothetical protein HH212_13875 [Massilia forsythiae]|uniref:M28 family peptidase n=1 Tax=Massilia forsythiae TaxID=2728020 RepID=A0A7Z2ZT48_9BURK|nr:hypothetical protein [Massilia forsythiae]QJE00984.1 hypothetical protein HH212_13875 [Massilia forsythiae]
MRSFFRAHWKVILAIVLLILLATVTVNPSAAAPMGTDARLAQRLRAHATVLAAGAGASYVAHTLRAEGYRVRIPAHPAGAAPVVQAALANLAPGAAPARLFVIGARYARPPAGTAHGGDADDAASGRAGRTAASASDGSVAAVLELARLLRGLHPRRGTEVRFVFFPGPAPDHAAQTAPCPARHPAGGPGCPACPGCAPDGDGFVAYAGTPASMHLVQEALAGFRSGADGPLRGLAAPAYVRGLTLSDRPVHGHAGAVAVMVTDTEFMRYPYHDTVDRENGEAATVPEDEFDDAGSARVVAALARTIAALAQNRRG